MAQILQINKKNPRRKKWEHFKLQYRKLVFRISLVINVIFLIYLLKENGQLTTIINMVNPILEAIKLQLPL